MNTLAILPRGPRLNARPTQLLDRAELVIAPINPHSLHTPQNHPFTDSINTTKTKVSVKQFIERNSAVEQYDSAIRKYESATQQYQSFNAAEVGQFKENHVENQSNNLKQTQNQYKYSKHAQNQSKYQKQAQNQSKYQKQAQNQSKYQKHTQNQYNHPKHTQNQFKCQINTQNQSKYCNKAKYQNIAHKNNHNQSQQSDSNSPYKLGLNNSHQRISNVQKHTELINKVKNGLTNNLNNINIESNNNIINKQLRIGRINRSKSVQNNTNKTQLFIDSNKCANITQRNNQRLVQTQRIQLQEVLGRKRSLTILKNDTIIQQNRINSHQWSSTEPSNREQINNYEPLNRQLLISTNKKQEVQIENKINGRIHQNKLNDGIHQNKLNTESSQNSLALRFHALQEQYAALEAQSRHERKLILSIKQMRAKLLQITPQQSNCSLKQLWKWIKSLPR